MRKRCDTCRYWKKQTDNNGYCEKTEQWASGQVAYEDSLCIIVGAGDFGAHLETHKTFGCVQWEKQT